MRIRTVKPDFFSDEDLQDLEVANPGAYVMLVFAGLWGCCDKQGVFEWRPRTLKRNVLPFLPYEMESTLAILTEAGFIIPFTAEGRGYGYVPTFRRHQRINGKEAQAPPLYPAPPGEVLDQAKRGKHRGSTGEATEHYDELPPDSATEGITPGKRLVEREAPGKQPGSTGEATETTGREGKGREEEGKEKACLLIPPTAEKAPVMPAAPVERAREPTRTENALRQCVRERREQLVALFPGADIDLETEELVAKYGQAAIGADPWLIVVRWFRNVPKGPRGGRDGGRPGGGTTPAGRAAPAFTDRTTDAFCARE